MLTNYNHRVVTTIPTQVTTGSARCNGVAIIGGGVFTSGYFEYGNSYNLGSNTTQVNIGNQNSTQYSSAISGLSPNTIYYCRAVITNINGTYRGEVMSFRTESNRTPYVPYVPTPKVKTTTTVVKTISVVNGKKVTRKSVVKAEKGGVDEVVTCKDSSGNTSTIKAGEKLMSLEITKSQGKLLPGETLEYSVRYDNTSKIKLSNVKVKVTLPAELTFIGGNNIAADQGTNTITANLGDINAMSGGVVKILAKVNGSAKIGGVVVINAHASYEMLNEKGEAMRDESTAYLISTIVSDSMGDVKSNTSKSSDGILPSTFVEWLAILVMILVLAFLGRNIYLNINGDHKKSGH